MRRPFRQHAAPPPDRPAHMESQWVMRDHRPAPTAAEPDRHIMARIEIFTDPARPTGPARLEIEVIVDHAADRPYTYLRRDSLEITAADVCSPLLYTICAASTRAAHAAITYANAPTAYAADWPDQPDQTDQEEN